MKIYVMVAAMLSFHAHAQVYKCKEGNSVTFSAVPCSADSKPIDVRPASGRSSLENQVVGKVNSDDTRSLQQRGSDAANRRALDDEIYRKQRQLSSLQAEMESKLTGLRNKKTFSANNMAGAIWEQSISEEMQAVTAAYDIQIKAAQHELDDLRQRRAKIPNN